MKTSFSISQTFRKLTPADLYRAWLDSETHGNMTGGVAECDPVEGGEFSAWDGYIHGKNLELIEHEKIVQSWRTIEFGDTDEESKLTIDFRPTNEGTELILTHTNIPEGQPDYEKGWIDNYFEPMKKYFDLS
jgi:activator of HSP90 ATPase